MKVVFRQGFLDITLLFIVVVIALGAILTTGFKSKSERGTESLVPEAQPAEEEKRSIQLNTLKFKKVELPKGNSCKASEFNEEPDIFIGSDPPPGETARVGGKIRVWLDDGNGGSMARGEQIDATTGRVTKEGDRLATDGKGAGYYLWEPALYVTLLTSPNQPGPYSGDAEQGGQAKFPQEFRGKFLYEDNGSNYLNLPSVESPAGFGITRAGHGKGKAMAQVIWDVDALNLTPGIYRAQFVVHDGDGDLAINCITIQI